jgi:hypothetical protein
MSLTEKIDAEIKAVEADAKSEAGSLFDKAKVDLREELPGLMGKLGINTSDESTVVHSSLVLILKLLAEYGPAEIRDVLAVVAAA